MSTTKKPSTAKTPVTNAVKTPTAKTPVANAAKASVTKASVTKTPEALVPVETVVVASQETVDQVVKASTEAATKSVEKAVEVTQEQVAVAAKAGNDVFQAYEDVVTYGKDNFDAVLNANTIFTKGLQNLNEEIFAIFQTSFEANATATKKILACTNVQDVVALQNDLVQEGYSKAMDQSKKITDLSVKVTEQTTAPLSERVSVTVEKFAKPLAA